MEDKKCIVCQNEFLSSRIRCKVCKDYDLCLQCFACGAENGEHKKDHDYTVHHDEHYTIFENEEGAWTSIEEAALLDAVEQYGFGNWDDIAKFVKTKVAYQCRDHFSQFYIQGEIGKETVLGQTIKIQDHSCPTGGPLSPSLGAVLPPVDLSMAECQALGFMPLRDDFEREFDNNAETLVSSLDIHYEDDSLDEEFKLAQADMYRQRLKTRSRWKRAARVNKLFPAIHAQLFPLYTPKSRSLRQRKEKALPPELRQLQEKLRVFSGLLPSDTHDQLLEDIHKESTLRVQIQQLAKYRRQGITKHEESKKYDTEMAARERRERRKPTSAAATATCSKKPSTDSRSISTEESKSEDGDAESTITEARGDRDVPVLADGCQDEHNLDILSKTEKNLCDRLGLPRDSYITIKTCIIQDYLHRKKGVPAKIRYPSHLDKKHRRTILNFLMDNNWIPASGTG